MHSKRLLGLLVAGLSAMTVVETTFVVPRVQNGFALLRRQGTGGDDDTTPTTTGPPPPTSSPPPPNTSNTPSPSPSQPQSPPPPPTTRTTTTRPPPPPPTTTPRTSEPPAPTDPPKSDPPTDGDDEPLPPSTVTQIVTKVDDQGRTYTTEQVTTHTPGLASNNKNQPSGMSEETRNTVIGVVVGVGGAIILGGLAFVAWRIWGRKKNEENDDLMDYNSTAEKPDTSGSMNGRTPFQSTLESYHAPTQVNQAANF